MEEQTNELGFTRSFGYDLAGNLTQKTDRLERVTSYAFDNLHRNVGEIWYPSVDEVGPGDALREFSFDYDLYGNLKSSNDGVLGDYDYVFTYDDLDRLDTSTMNITGLGREVFFDLSYDRMNNRTSISTQIDSISDYANSYVYDSLYRIRSVTQTGTAVADKHVEFAFDEAGQLDFFTRYAGQSTTEPAVALTDYDYDESGRLNRIEHHRSDSPSKKSLINGYAYSHDLANRITSMQVLGHLYVDESVSDYDYNYRDELISADYNANYYNENYDYDGNGNRTTSQNENGNEAHQTDDNNQLTDDGTYTYTYDQEGNRLTRTAKPSHIGDEGVVPLTEYGWDHRNRMVSVTHKDEAGIEIKLVTYGYDDLNQQISRTVDESSQLTHRYFVYDDSQIVMQFDGEGATTAALTHRYLWGPKVDQQLADEQVEIETEAGRVVWALSDHLGSVRDLVAYADTQNVTGTIEWKHRRYDSFGNVQWEYNRGDFNGDGNIDMTDVDALFDAIDNDVFDDLLSGGHYDLNGDGVLNEGEITTWVQDILETVMSDANLDGAVGGADFIIWNTNKFNHVDEYFTEGDFNLDGVVDGQDFIVWNNQKFTNYELNDAPLEYIFGFTGRMYDDEIGMELLSNVVF